MTPGCAAYVAELLAKRVGDLEVGELKFLKTEVGRQPRYPSTRLAEVFGAQKPKPPSTSPAER